ncbi:MAG: GGDEF domain-containing protein [Planctomycetota bacterium]
MPNRVAFEGLLALVVESARTERRAYALCFIDLDRFKPVNDAHGHAAGDQVLRTVGSRLASVVRPSDAVARLGGDEFAIVLVGVREGLHAKAVAEKAIAATCEPIQVGAHLTVEISASVGVAFGADRGGWKELVDRADARLYQAKKAGRCRSTVSDFLPL